VSDSDRLWAVIIAVAISLLLAAIEIPNRSKTSLAACLGVQSVFYWLVLALGNSVTTLLASVGVAKLSAGLSHFYFFAAAFFGVFAFEAILKNTNITMFDRGVLTIQDWIQNALNGASGAAIAKQATMRQRQQNLAIDKLKPRSDQEINTLVLNKLGPGVVETLEEAAKKSSADVKLYKIMQLVSQLTPSEYWPLSEKLTDEPRGPTRRIEKKGS